MSSYHRTRFLRALAAAALAAAAISGCTTLNIAERDSLAAHIDYMRRAAEADQHVWQEMKTDAEQRANSDPSESRLQLGFLLTSPSQSLSNTEAGEKMLREAIESEPGMDPRLQDLIQVRLQETEARRVLTGQLRDVKSKIDELLSIESSMEQKKSKSDIRQP